MFKLNNFEFYVTLNYCLMLFLHDLNNDVYIRDSDIYEIFL